MKTIVGILMAFVLSGCANVYSWTAIEHNHRDKEIKAIMIDYSHGKSAIGWMPADPKDYPLYVPIFFSWPEGKK